MTDIDIDMVNLPDNYWKNLGYKTDPPGLGLPTIAPAGYEGIGPGSMVQEGDIYFSLSSKAWAMVPERIAPHGIDPEMTAFMRPIRKKIWLCKGPACDGRENDQGHACYWCGGRET